MRAGNRGAERPVRAWRRGEVATSLEPGLVTESTCACIYVPIGLRYGPSPNTIAATVVEPRHQHPFAPIASSWAFGW
jgi:hypothetical protein